MEPIHDRFMYRLSDEAAYFAEYKVCLRADALNASSKYFAIFQRDCRGREGCPVPPGLLLIPPPHQRVFAERRVAS